MNLDDELIDKISSSLAAGDAKVLWPKDFLHSSLSSPQLQGILCWFEEEEEEGEGDTLKKKSIFTLHPEVSTE